MSAEQLEAKLTNSGSTLYYALQRLPDSHRLPCLGLFALHRELHDLVFNRSETVHIKFAWWHEECARLIDGQPRHPITQAIAKWRGHADANVPGWLANLEVPLTSGFRDETELFGLCSSLTRPLFAACSRLTQDMISPDSDESHDQAVDAASAAAYTLFGFMQELGQYLRHGIVPIPRSDLGSAPLTAGDILSQGLTPSFQSIMQVQYNRLSKLLSELCEPSPANPVRTQPVVSTILAIQRATLKEMQRANFDIIDRQIDITPLRKTWIAWKTYRKVKQHG